MVSGLSEGTSTTDRKIFEGFGSWRDIQGLGSLGLRMILDSPCSRNFSRSEMNSEIRILTYFCGRCVSNEIINFGEGYLGR